MEKKKVAPVWVSIVLLVLCAAVLVHNVISVIGNQSGIIYDISLLAETISIIAAIFYCASGYKKISAVYFHLVVVTRLIAAVFALYLQYQPGQTSAFAAVSFILKHLNLY